MTGQVDEAGREWAEVLGNHRLVSWNFEPIRCQCGWEGDSIWEHVSGIYRELADREVVGLRTQLAACEERAEKQRQECEGWDEAGAESQAQMIAELDALAGQVAAIRALCDEAEAWARPTGSGAPHVSIDRIRAALVASSPTTRPTHPESTSPSRTALDPEAPK